MEDNKYVIKYGVKAYLLSIIFIILFVGVCVLFWFCDEFMFYFTIVFLIISILLLLYQFIKTKIIINGNIIEAHVPFKRKTQSFDISKITKLTYYFGREIYLFEDNTKLMTSSLYMTNVKKLLDKVKNQLEQNNQLDK